MKNNTRTKKRWLQDAVKIKLPEDYPWKVLSKLSLDLKEYLQVDDFERLSKIVRNRDFAAYLRLSEGWGLQCIPPIDVSLAELRAKYLLASLIKKFQFQTDQEKRIARATEIFFAAEQQCNLYNQFGYKELEKPETDWGVEILHYARVFLVKLLGDRLPGHREMLDRARHGPGATIGTKHGNTSLYFKYSEWPYSCTVGAFRYARFAIETDQRWIGALQDDYRSRFNIPKQMPINMRKFWSKVINVVESNRIAFVPKDAQKERTIAIEPNLNLYLQLGVDGFIRRRLKRFGVDLDSQEKNQYLARLGSLPNSVEKFVTIDLKAASDSISLKLCELLLPREWLTYLSDLRCPSGTLDGEMIHYGKISSMGNGFTFALESAIFTALIFAVMKAAGESFDHSLFAVFGDDLVIPQRHYFRLVEALRLSGFSINLEKTFVFGHVRESCGTDWFQGLPLRPVFLDTVPTNAMELFCDYNRLKRLLTLRWDVEESEVLSLIRKWIPEKVCTFVGPYSDEDFDSYIHIQKAPLGQWRDSVYRYNRLVIQPIPQKGRNFLFRKLMHDLRGQANSPAIEKWNWWRKLGGGGSRFTVTSRKALTVGKAVSVADIWRSEYTEYYPPARGIYAGR